MKLVYLEVNASGLGHLWLNRPEKLNAFSAQFMDDFLLALDEAERACATLRLRVLIVASKTPKAFCSGADLGERIAMTEAQVSATLEKQRIIMDRVAALEMSTMAVIDGIAFGGGLELALACDLRLATPTAQMGLTELKVGVIPGAGGTARLTRLLGISRAKELIFRAKKVSGTEALSLGLLNAVDAKALALSESWAAEILETAPLALRSAKHALDRGADLELPRALDEERACYETVLHSLDRVEGLKAFVEKRKPIFFGK